MRGPLTRTWTTRRAVGVLVRFGWMQLQSCFFAIALFVGLVVTSVVTVPIPRYDALLGYVLLLTAVFWLLKLETGREVAVIFGFHLLGLALEVYKVRVGSWSYPGEAWSKVGGVPLYAGFMYAAVGSYLCQAWRRFDLRVTGYPAVPLTLLAVAIYANFFTHHVLPDVRWVLAGALVLTLRRTWVHFTVGRDRFRMPLAAAFVLIGLFLWVAENAATFLGAWSYPDQVHAWTLVHAGKLGSWSLLVSLSFVLVATVKATEGRLYGDRDGAPTVTGAPSRGPIAGPPRGDAVTRRRPAVPGWRRCRR